MVNLWYLDNITGAKTEYRTREIGIYDTLISKNNYGTTKYMNPRRVSNKVNKWEEKPNKKSKFINKIHPNVTPNMPKLFSKKNFKVN